MFSDVSSAALGSRGDNTGLGPSAVALVVDNQLANTAATREVGLNCLGSLRLVDAPMMIFSVWLAGQYLVEDRISYRLLRTGS